MRDWAAEREAVRNAARKRIHNLSFGDPVTNVCAGEGNPTRHSYFVRKLSDCVETTDKKGRFTKTMNEVIFPGHLPYDECRRLFTPIWEAEFRRESPHTSRAAHEDK